MLQHEEHLYSESRRYNFSFMERCRFFRVFFVPFPLSLGMESTSYALSFRMVFFLPCDHGLDFDISLYEDPINQSIKECYHRMPTIISSVVSF